MRLKRATTLAGLATMLTVTATALAEPARTVTVNRDKPTAAWEDGPRSAAGNDAANPAPMCSQGFPCDDTLIKVDTAGALTFTADASGQQEARPDVDIYLFLSDAAGTEGDQIAAGETPETDETLVADVEPGWYLARTAYYSGIQVSYKGSLKLEPVAPPPSSPPPSGGTTPPPPSGGSAPPAQAAPSATNRPPQAVVAGLKRSVRRSALKSFRGTASDDAGVAKVELGLLRIRGRRCTQLTSRGTFRTLRPCKTPTTFVAARGTNAWTFRLKRRLSKGRYVLFARATDSAGAVQPGFSGASRAVFRVR